MSDHGYDPAVARAVAAVRRLDTAEIRLSMEKTRAELTQPGVRCPKRIGISLISIIGHLCNSLDQARVELRQTAHYQYLYGALVTDYNGLIETLRSLGIEISQPSGSERWHWSYGPQTGAAPTVAGAAAQALRACGAIPWHDEAAYADEAAQRAAQRAEDANGS
jgi:hypothetical protein